MTLKSSKGYKTITFLRDDVRVEVPIVYSIFDANNTAIMEDNFETEARNSRHALSLYFKEKGIEQKVKRSGREDVVYCVSPQFFDEGIRYKAGKIVWYAPCG